MALEEFERERFSERDKNLIRMRSMTNYVMGILLVAAGFFFFFPMEKTAPLLSQYDPSLMKVMAVVCWIYGIFRIYRGYKKNYFRES